MASGQQIADVLDRIAAHVLEHRTTLVFVNTRKMAERVAHQLALRLGSPDAADRPADDGLGTASDAIPEVDRMDAALQVAAHHGSLSAARRRIVEQRLRAGDLRALVATASLELGIDVGPVELVCQIGSPRAIGTFLQRVGRANHQLEGTPAGRLYPLTRDELVECTALLAGVRAGHLDVLHPPTAPLDVLAQQVVAEVAAAGEWEVGPLYDLVRGAAPYAELTRETFDEVVDMVSWGIPTGRGRRGAHLHHDAVNGRLRPRRGARLAALTSGGAIPETGDYRVVLDPDGVTVGSVHEDFAVEATAGDIFLLGTHSWRVVKVETGTVRVHDAGDLPPTIPFWLGEAPARTAELSAEVGALRAELEPLLGAGDGDSARQVVRRTAGVSEEVATQVVAYLGAGLAALGALPTRDRLVIETGLRRERRNPAHRPLALRRTHQPGLRAGPAQKVLCLLRFRIAGGGRRRHRRPLPRPAAQLPFEPGAEDAAQRYGHRRPDPGRAPPPDAGRPVALESQPGIGGAPLAWRSATSDPSPADGGRRPAGGGLAGAGRLSGERRSRVRYPSPITCWSARRSTTVSPNRSTPTV